MPWSREARAQATARVEAGAAPEQKGIAVNRILSGRVLDLSMLGRDVDARYRRPAKSMSSLTL
jgi:hypothetical protein